MPKRIQRKRTKGWKMPEGAVYVGRPTKWGNPIRIGYGRSRAEAVEMFHRIAFGDGRRIDEIRSHLRGKDLACWCSLDQACHADVLLEIANS